MDDAKTLIAKRAALELNDGDVVNLGIGIPNLIAEYIPDDIDVCLDVENGCLRIGGLADENNIDLDLGNSSSEYATLMPGASVFDSATSFALIRGGHLDVVILGAMQVDESGSIANWKVPGGKLAGMGGAMDLVVGAKKLIVTMTHTQKGKPKIVKKCSLPLTARNKVDLIITEMAVIKVTPQGLVLQEVADGVSVEDVIKNTEAHLIIPESVGVFGL